MQSRLCCLTFSLTLLAACGGDDADVDVDDVAPDTTFTATPTGDLDTADDSVFALACDEAACTFECSVDDGPFGSCDPALTVRRLAAGAHTLAARAIDAAGNVDATPATHAWSLAFGWSGLAVGETTACAISGEGGLYCWGTERYGGELGNGGGFDDTLTRATRIGAAADWEDLTAGYTAYCGHRAGALYCWGANFDGELGDPAIVDRAVEPTAVDLDVVTVSIGEYHGCGLDADGALSCWGDNGDGQLGIGDTEEHAGPVAVGTRTWRQLSVGSGHSCAIATTGALFCWGANSGGQCGQAIVTVDDEQILVPTQVGAATDWVQVSTGDGHTCARTAADALWCWGDGYRGQLGDGTTTTWSATPVAVAGTWRDVTGSTDGTCAVATDGRASCWGDNLRAQLGSVTLLAAEARSPEPISHAGTVRAVAGRSALRCALGERDILCWGDNNSASGGLGRGVAGGELQVVTVDGGWAQVAMDDSGGCGLRTDGTLACWGLGAHVTGATPLAYAPRDVSSDADWTAVDVSVYGGTDVGHACGLRAGRLFCWGVGAQGQLGNGGTNPQGQPVEVPQVTGSWASVSTGAFSTCAITDGGALYCWGGGTNAPPGSVPNWGQVGDGTQLQRNTPVAITTPAAQGWSSVHVFDRRVSAVRTDGTLWGWGLNPNVVSVSVPTQIGTDADWQDAMTTAGGVTCARKISGALYCTWYQFNPGWARPMIQVGTATDHVRLVPFVGGACSLRGDGELHCYWGTSTGWADNYPSYDVNGTIPAPTGPWASFSGGYALRCGVRADGTRACAGARFTGSFGDGFDERQPTPILLP